ncbi:MAG: hypothetical protein Q8916_11150 [Bacteroidota bacterium]|nr:hypothetical protein [Bacteroidota bacterium]
MLIAIPGTDPSESKNPILKYKDSNRIVVPKGRPILARRFIGGNGRPTLARRFIGGKGRPTSARRFNGGK